MNIEVIKYKKILTKMIDLQESINELDLPFNFYDNLDFLKDIIKQKESVNREVITPTKTELGKFSSLVKKTINAVYLKDEPIYTYPKTKKVDRFHYACGNLKIDKQYIDKYIYLNRYYPPTHKGRTKIEKEIVKSIQTEILSQFNKQNKELILNQL